MVNYFCKILYYDKATIDLFKMNENEKTLLLIKEFSLKVK